ncbi:MAG: hypothetical protein OXF93_24770 [Acidobacteria bacterium]|nr:hypothetical protein [Acidobacteriota bacterium]
MREKKGRLMAAIVASIGLFLLVTIPHDIDEYGRGLARLTERVLTQWFPPEPPPQVPGVSELERGAWRTLGRLVNGRLLWSSNRNGNHDLYLVELGSGAERRLTDHPHVDFFSRFSPDGTQVSFLRSQRPWVSFRDETAWDLYVMNADGSGQRLLVEGAYHPTWRPDGAGLVYVFENRIFDYNLASGTAAVIHRGSDPPTRGRVLEPELSADGLLAITLREVPYDTVGVLDPVRQRFRGLASVRSCQITWFPGRRQAVWIGPRGAGGTRVMTADLPDGTERPLIDLPGEYSHEYFPRVTLDGKWLVWGASAGGHEHDRADYEIFVWRIGEPWSTATRVTYSPANDQWPDLFVDGEG